MCKKVQNGKDCIIRYYRGYFFYSNENGKSVIANVINSDEVNFLCGKEAIKGWKTKVDMEDDRLEFKEQDKVVELRKLEGGN